MKDKKEGFRPVPPQRETSTQTTEEKLLVADMILALALSGAGVARFLSSIAQYPERASDALLSTSITTVAFLAMWKRLMDINSRK